MNDALPPETSVLAVETPACRQIEDNLRNFARAAGALSGNTARALKADMAIFAGWCAEDRRAGQSTVPCMKAPLRRLR